MVADLYGTRRYRIVDPHLKPDDGGRARPDRALPVGGAGALDKPATGVGHRPVYIGDHRTVKGGAARNVGGMGGDGVSKNGLGSERVAAVGHSDSIAQQRAGRDRALLVKLLW